MKTHLLLCLLVVVTPLLGQQAPPNSAASQATRTSATAHSSQKPQHPRMDVATIAKETKGAVVSIVMADQSGKPICQGSGFVVTRNGLVVTNYHVIKTGSEAIVKLPDGSFFTVDGVLASDKKRDIAVIKVHGNNFKTLALGNSDRLEVGEEVVAIGSPLSLESTVSNGIVSGIRSESEDVFGPVNPLLQITAPISHGSSGGPLFNMFGQVVGITSAALVGGENLNFAIPINDAKKLLVTSSSTNLHAFPDEPEETAHEKSAPPDTVGPSLAETQQWMNKFTGAYARLNGKSATVLSFDGCEVTEHDFIGENLNVGGQAKEIKGVSYALSDLDPTQISVKSNMVQFATTNAKESINHSGIFYSANWIVLFDNSEHANEFVGGFKRAVELCGGQKSTSAVTPNVTQSNGESLCGQAASAAVERFSKLPFLHDGATQWDYDYHYVPTDNASPKCFIWFRSAHQETFTAPGAIPSKGLRFEDSGYSLDINSGSVGEGPEILRFESVVLDKGTDTEVSRVFDCEVDNRSVQENGSKTECQTWEQLRNLVVYMLGIKYTGRLR